jgi:hypothetical protein
MEIQIATSKVRKYATRTSGDTVEIIERPNGGVSVVMADGQSSGRGAKWVSSFVVRKVISLLADGVRDGARRGQPPMRCSLSAADGFRPR